MFTNVVVTHLLCAVTSHLMKQQSLSDDVIVYLAEPGLDFVPQLLRSHESLLPCCNEQSESKADDPEEPAGGQTPRPKEPPGSDPGGLTVCGPVASGCQETEDEVGDEEAASDFIQIPASLEHETLLVPPRP